MQHFHQFIQNGKIIAQMLNFVELCNFFDNGEIVTQNKINQIETWAKNKIEIFLPIGFEKKYIQLLDEVLPILKNASKKTITYNNLYIV